jgi:hypothetical protein
VGASIQLWLNVHNNKRGKVGYSTYLFLIGIQCFGLPLASLISPPHKVIREDGTRIVNRTKEIKDRDFTGEVRRFWALLKTKRMYLLIPILIGFPWNSTYQSIYMTEYFSVRSRALGALMSGVAAISADIFWGHFFDLKRFSRPLVAKLAWFSFVVTMLGIFSWQIINEHLYSTTEPKPTLDWNNKGFGRAFTVTVLFRYVQCWPLSWG